MLSGNKPWWEEIKGSRGLWWGRGAHCPSPPLLCSRECKCGVGARRFQERPGVVSEGCVSPSWARSAQRDAPSTAWGQVGEALVLASPCPLPRVGLASPSLLRARGVPTLSVQSLVVYCWGKKKRKKKERENSILNSFDQSTSFLPSFFPPSPPSFLPSFHFFLSPFS